jgi:crotonobetainyl-CoA:carnitine CoA-transferase CaiB-like acyl-CoA transferase
MNVKSAGALSGLRVIELSRYLPGALAAQMLGDLGCEVVKVEQPGTGDPTRGFSPRLRGDSGAFLLSNRNKRSITVDLKTTGGQKIIHRLAMQSDVVVEGFRPGVADRLAIGDSALRGANPKLIYCSISGYGQSGPYRDIPGHDLNYLGLVGMLQLIARPETGPLVPGPLIADISGGALMALFGILAALLARGRTGVGQFVDVSMTDGSMALMVSHAAEYLFGGEEPAGGKHRIAGGSAPYNIYRCADARYLTLGIIEPHFWKTLRAIIERPDLASEPFGSPEETKRAQIALTEAFSTRNRDDWVEILWRNDIPAGPVNSFAEASSDPQIMAREMILNTDHPVEGRIPQLGFPVKFSGTPGQITRPPPLLGEHNDEVLSELGFDVGEIAELRQARCI